MKKPYPRVGFVIKHRQPEAASLAQRLAKEALDSGLAVAFCDESTAVAEPFKSKAKIIPKAELMDHADLIVVLGGDGTYLSIARLMRDRSIPVMGINMGQLGFLTEFKKDEAPASFKSLIDGTAPPVISERALLEVTLCRNGETVFRGPVVNDAVISKGAIARIIGMDVHVNGQYAHGVRADGLIVATPTGSTAYSLAAGGPIIEPSLPAVVIAAICPHSLTQRPLVIPDSAALEIHLKDRPGHVLLTLDGQDAVDMTQGDVVKIQRFKKHALQLISSPGRDYFGLLREKLKFGLRD